MPSYLYLRRYRVMVALTIARAVRFRAMATLALPLGVRRMVDFGFDRSEGAAMIDNYFLTIFRHWRALLAVASAVRFYSVTWLGERIVADLRRDVFRHG